MDNEYSIHERKYAKRTKSEQHIIDFAYRILTGDAPRLDEMLPRIQAEYDKYKSAHPNCGELIIGKPPAGQVLATGKQYWKIVIQRPGQYPSLEIHEKMV